MVYTEGLIRELMMPLALTIIYTLLSSLLISMTVVPAACSTLLRNTKPREHKYFDKLLEGYGKLLSLCLKVKVVPLAIAVALLIFSIFIALRSGIVMIPDALSSQIEGSVVYNDENMTREECYADIAEMTSRMTRIEGVKSVCVMSGNSDMALMFGASDDSYDSYALMVLCDNDDAGAAEVRKIPAVF